MFDAGMIPDWIRTLAVLRRKPRRWPPTSVLEELASDGHIEASGQGSWLSWSATDMGLKALRAWEKINGPAEDPRRYEQRPSATLSMALEWATNLATLEKNTDGEREALEVICNDCDKVRTDGDGNWCSVCGCGTSAYDRRVFNLCSYRERPPIRLCKHPERGITQGKGWPLPILPTPTETP